MKIAAQFESKDGKLLFIKTGATVRTDNFIKIDFDGDAQAFADLREKNNAARVASQNGGTSQGDDGAESRGDETRIIALRVPYESVALSDSTYNEAFLAALRNFIKDAEAESFYAVIVPAFSEGDAAAHSLQNGGFLSHEDAERVIAASCHTARRVKDCASVAGFAVPEPLSDNDARLFMEKISAKHAQYVYFSRAGRTGTLAFGFA